MTNTVEQLRDLRGNYDEDGMDGSSQTIHSNSYDVRGINFIYIVNNSRYLSSNKKMIWLI